MAEEISKRIGAFGQNVWKKAQDAYDIVGVNSDIAARARDLADVHEEIGKAYCATHKDDAAREFPSLCLKAEALEREIATLNDTVLRLRGRVKCPVCGKEAPRDAVFCPACGAKLPPKNDDATPVDEQTQLRSCRACGATLAPEDAYCSACGTRQDG